MKDEELLTLAEQSKHDFKRRRRTMEDFRYDEQQEKFWDTTTGNLLSGKSVDGAIHVDDWPTRIDQRSGEPKPQKPSLAINAIDTGLTVEGSTWWPGQPPFIKNMVATERGAMPMPGAMCYNAYMPPDHSRLDPGKESADRWIAHVRKLFPDRVEQEHFFDFCAHMLQRPDEKVNHGIVMAGDYGIGKDTALAPVRAGVGEWNAAEISPDAITGDYNGHVKTVLLVINEVRPQDEEHKASNFYNLLKPLLAAPPEMLPMTVKYANTIYVRNLCHVFLTTNDPLTMYIPGHDRRLFVMDSPVPNPGEEWRDYFDDIYAYFARGGLDAAVLWLLERDISEFNSNAPPPVTRGKLAIIESNKIIRSSPADEILNLIIDEIYDGKWPDVLFQSDLVAFIKTSITFDDEQKMLNAINKKNFHFKMAEYGYETVRNPDAKEWRNGKFRSRMAFIRKEVPREEQIDRIEEALSRRPLMFEPR